MTLSLLIVCSLNRDDVVCSRYFSEDSFLIKGKIVHFTKLPCRIRDVYTRSSMKSRQIVHAVPSRDISFETAKPCNNTQAILNQRSLLRVPIALYNVLFPSTDLLETSPVEENEEEKIPRPFFLPDSLVAGNSTLVWARRRKEQSNSSKSRPESRSPFSNGFSMAKVETST